MKIVAPVTLIHHSSQLKKVGERIIQSAKSYVDEKIRNTPANSVGGKTEIEKWLRARDNLWGSDDLMGREKWRFVLLDIDIPHSENAFVSEGEQFFFYGQQNWF